VAPTHPVDGPGQLREDINCFGVAPTPVVTKRDRQRPNHLVEDPRVLGGFVAVAGIQANPERLGSRGVGTCGEGEGSMEVQEAGSVQLIVALPLRSHFWPPITYVAPR